MEHTDSWQWLVLLAWVLAFWMAVVAGLVYGTNRLVRAKRSPDQPGSAERQVRARRI